MIHFFYHLYLRMRLALIRALRPHCAHPAGDSETTQKPQWRERRGRGDSGSMIHVEVKLYGKLSRFFMPRNFQSASPGHLEKRRLQRALLTEWLGLGKHQETAVPSFLFCSHFKITYGHNNAATLPRSPGSRNPRRDSPRDDIYHTADIK